eukprot:scaffold46171_cov29-Tisochrysis_lutea.AAC.5
MAEKAAASCHLWAQARSRAPRRLVSGSPRPGWRVDSGGDLATLRPFRNKSTQAAHAQCAQAALGLSAQPGRLVPPRSRARAVRCRLVPVQACRTKRPSTPASRPQRNAWMICRRAVQAQGHHCC